MAAGVEEKMAPRGRPQNENVQLNPELMSNIPVRKITNNNITTAVNYSRPQLERFVSHYQPKSSSKKKNDLPPSAGKSEEGSFPPIPAVTNPTSPLYENDPQNISTPINENDVDVNPNENRTTEKTPTGSERRRTKRQPKPRQVTVEKSCRRYDMNEVPNVRRNVEFLKYFRDGPVCHPRRLSLDKQAITPTQQDIHAPKQKNHLLSSESKDSAENELKENTPIAKYPKILQNASEANENIDPSKTSQQQNETNGNQSCSIPITPPATPLSAPFLGNESVIWVPSSRSEWDDCVDEMTAVCFAAAIRRHDRTNTENKPPPTPPLSRAYIRDRIDIDDPLRGYQIRHKAGGWLQGFVLMTTFTTWTHYFKWDSLDPKSGIVQPNNHGEGEKSIGLDDDGTLSAQLESQQRSGDPLSGGVVWPNLAEISLVGALGCGEYLLQMALDDIRRRGCYDYVVLQATDSSRPFYERFGFVRVGAVTKYGSKELFHAEQTVPNELPSGSQMKSGSAAEQLQVVGYRHWTYANETTQRLNKHHGGPSYMMAIKVSRADAGCKSMLDSITPYISTDKPVVRALGTSLALSRKKAPKDADGKSPIANTVVGGKKLKSSLSGRKRSFVDGLNSTGGEYVPFNHQDKKRKTEVDWRNIHALPAVTVQTQALKPGGLGTTPPLSETTVKAKRKATRPRQDVAPPLKDENLVPFSPLAMDAKRAKKDKKSFSNKNYTFKGPVQQKSGIRVRLSVKHNQEGKPLFEIKSITFDNHPGQVIERRSSSPLVTSEMRKPQSLYTTSHPPSNISIAAEQKQQETMIKIHKASNDPNAIKLVNQNEGGTLTGRPPIDSTAVGKQGGEEFGKSMEESEANMNDFVYKQRHSIWLAVPHQDVYKTKPKRRPPRQRGDVIFTETSSQNENILSVVSPDHSRKKDEKNKLPQCREGAIPRKKRSNSRDKPQDGGSALLSAKAQVSPLSPNTTPLGRKPAKGLLRKQRIVNQQRDPKKTYFYNKVVSPAATTSESARTKEDSNDTDTSEKLYFVLNYDEGKEEIQIIPLQPSGTFFGKRKGRIRWKATVVSKPVCTQEVDASELKEQWYNSMGVITVPCHDWKIVSAFAVIKTADVAEESWDIGVSS